MPGLLALALSVGGLGGVATWLALSPLAGFVTIWAIFIAWGAFFHSGGDNAALVSTIVSGIFGAVIAGVAFALITHVGLGSLPVTAAVWVGVMVVVLVLGSAIPIFSTVPVAVYGFAATAAYAIHAEPELAATAKTLLPDISNPVAVIALSFIVGAVFGWVSGKLAGALTSE